jgi:hypothetical protein
VAAAAVSLPGYGAEGLLLAGIAVWRLASGFVAVRQELGLGRLRSAATLAAGVIAGAGAVAAGSGLLGRVVPG